MLSMYHEVWGTMAAEVSPPVNAWTPLGHSYQMLAKSEWCDTFHVDQTFNKVATLIIVWIWYPMGKLGVCALNSKGVLYLRRLPMIVEHGESLENHCGYWQADWGSGSHLGKKTYAKDVIPWKKSQNQNTSTRIVFFFIFKIGFFAANCNMVHTVIHIMQM